MGDITPVPTGDGGRPILRRRQEPLRAEEAYHLSEAPVKWKTISSWLRCLVVIFLILPDGPVFAAQPITAIWANTGEDKVTQDELRATKGANVKNSVWDGSKITIFGARNEVVAFNVILEAGSGGAGNVTVTFNKLTGPSGATITSSAATGDGVFNWVGRNIELFYVRYLQINGLSLISYQTSIDERQVPQRFERPWTGAGVATGGWTDRPDHNKFYPDIAVPLELVPNFNIAANQNQSIWVDVYIPRTSPAGNYIGNLVVQAGGSIVGSIPVQLQVYNFTLPDTPNAKTMLYFDSSNINQRYLGSTYINPNSGQGPQASLLLDRHAMLAHRHRLSLIGDNPGNDCNPPGDQPCPAWGPRLDGSLFTAANGYDGPGVGVGNGIYSIGTYGSWSWNTGTQTDMNTHTDAWATWFTQNAPGVEYFLYLIDESSNYPQIQTWASWILANPGPGQQVRSMATIDLPTAASQTPALDIPTSTMSQGITSVWQSAADQYTNDPRKRFYMYNAHRPASGSTATEDDGIALRELAWGQYKKHINRWFFWETTYYNNYQGGTGQTDLFKTAQTFGGIPTADPVLGLTGWNYANGDGVMFYPGTDTVFPADSYGVDGPFASLRLKFWRRGIQDVDYLTMAAAIDPATTQNIVNQIVPKVLWEYGVDNPSDPTYVHTSLSWSNDPNVWEAARLQLATIIAGAPPGTGGSGGLPAPTLALPPTLPVDAEVTAGYPSGYNIVSFLWSFIPNAIGAQASGGAAASRVSTANFSTPGATAQLAAMDLSPGAYQITVMAIDNNNNISPPGQAAVTLVAVGANTASIRVFPNPWRSDQPYAHHVTFDQLPDGASVKIFTVSGHWVKNPPTVGNAAIWDLTSDTGASVASGIYVYVVKTPDGNTIRGKLAVIQ